jgi:hypothetical protein
VDDGDAEASDAGTGHTSSDAVNAADVEGDGNDGPAALLAAATNGSGAHPYEGYRLCAFPDSIDSRAPDASGYDRRTPSAS